MPKRFVSIWFRYLKTDWMIRRHPSLRDTAFVLTAAVHGRMIVTAADQLAEKEGIYPGMVLADAKAIFSSLQYFDDEPGRPEKLLNGLAEWFIRFTPVVAIDPPAGLILDATGCAHLWGGEKEYLTEICKRLKNFGYHVRIAIADTIGAAWAIARHGQDSPIVATGRQTTALLSLPPAALRLDTGTIDRLEKLGLRQVSQFIHMPRPALRRRFGPSLLLRLDQALGHRSEGILPVIPIEPYQERLPCMEPIVTATGIEMALQRLLDALCQRLSQEEKGLRVARFTCYRVDGKIESIEIGTNHPSCNPKHLFNLFNLKIETIEPALGIELFILEAPAIEDHSPVQEKLWSETGRLDDIGLAELLDRIGGKLGAKNIARFVPEEHYWPERSFKAAGSLQEKLCTTWHMDKPRPLQLLKRPEPIEVTAPIPDYPPMMFRHNKKLHKIIKADGPERIEQEWWLQEGQHRDYYYVEDEEGKRYWLFRSGHYEARAFQWFLHGFFA